VQLRVLFLLEMVGTDFAPIFEGTNLAFSNRLTILFPIVLYLEGPQGMLKGAVLYGGMMYLLSGSGGIGGKKEPFQYKEQPIDF
jgi:hypothetical protein